MTEDNNRLLLEFSQNLKDINFDVINSEIPDLCAEQLKPVLHLVARARATYIKEIFDLSISAGEELPSAAEVEQLKEYRIRYEELLNGAQALETAIQRGYIAIKESV